MTRRYKALRQPDHVVLSGVSEEKKSAHKPPKGTAASMFKARLSLRPRFTRDEVRHQTEVIEALMTMGGGDSQIVNQVSKVSGLSPNALGISKYRAVALIERIRAQWDSEDQTQRLARKSAQIRRIMNNIQRCRTKLLDPKIGERDRLRYEAAMHKWETAFMDVAGTRDAIEVNVNVHTTETLVQVFSEYSLEKLQKLSEEAEQEHQMALAYQREHPELPQVIDVESE